MIAAELKEGRETLEVIAKPNVFSAVVAITAIVLYLGSQWLDRLDRREEHTTTVAVLREVSGRLERIEQLAVSNNNMLLVDRRRER